MKRVLFWLIVMAVPATTVFAKKYENKSYVPRTDSLPLTIAIIPIGHEDNWVKTKLDSHFVSYYDDSGLVLPDGPASWRQEIANDSTLAAILTQIAEYEYSKDERKVGPSLYSVLDSTQVSRLASSLGWPDLLLLPTKFGLGSLLGRAAGKLSVRLYDLHTGELIYEKDQDLNVDATGEIGAEYIIIGLIGITREPYHKFVLKQLAK